MKVIVLALALGTATAALPNPNMFLVEHEANTTMYSVVPHAMMTLVGALLLGIHRTAFDKSIGRLHRLNEFKKNLPKGYCPCCLEENIQVIILHPAADGSEGKCMNCVNCLINWHKGSKIPLNAWGQKTHFTCPCCRAKIANTPLVKKAISLGV